MAVQGPIGPTAIDVTMDRRTELQRLAATRAALDPERRRTRADVLLSRSQRRAISRGPDVRHQRNLAYPFGNEQGSRNRSAIWGIGGAGQSIGCDRQPHRMDRH